MGTALKPETYDYPGALLWNDHASELWQYFTIYLRREIARGAGLTQKAAREQSRVRASRSSLEAQLIARHSKEKH